MHKLVEETSKLDFSYERAPELHKIILSYIMKSQKFKKNLDSLNNIWRYTDGPCLPEETQSILALTSYLYVVEGIYSLLLDVMIFNLIKTEDAEIVDRNGAKVEEFEKMTNVYLSKKRKFLRCHEYSEVLNIINPDLRNAIAHHDFNIREDGMIVYTNTNKKQWCVSRQDIYDMIGRIKNFSGFVKYQRSNTIRIK